MILLQASAMRVLRDWKKMGVILLILMIVIYDLSLLLSEYIKHGDAYYPAMAAFLSGNSRAHLPQMLLLWNLPIFLLILVGDNYIEERKKGVSAIIITKVGKRKYIIGKLIEGFTVSSIVMFSALLINYLLAIILFKEGVYDKQMFRGVENQPINQLLLYSAHHKNIVYFGFLLVATFLSGLCGMVCTAVCLIFPEKIIAYPIAFLLWFLFVTIKGSSVMNLFQPFTEYDYDYLLPIFIKYISLAIFVILISYIVKVRRDEI